MALRVSFQYGSETGALKRAKASLHKTIKNLQV
jgi:hypothetical protein